MDFSSFFGDQALLKLFALMTLEIDSMQVDFDRLELRYDYGNSSVPMSAFGIGPKNATIDLEFVVKQVYDEPNGKFSLVFGNAAMIDCSRVFAEFRDALLVKLEPYETLDPVIYNRGMKVLNEVTNWILERGITFCDFAYDLEGVLKDQSDYYLGTYD